MSTPIKAAKVMLVTIIAGYEMKERISTELSAFGVSGCTVVRADGHGLHGTRKFGFVDGANVRIEVIVLPEFGVRILDLIATSYAGEAVLAYAQDVLAVPSERFA
jgi:nitrogen regulatory protein PII